MQRLGLAIAWLLIGASGAAFAAPAAPAPAATPSTAPPAPTPASESAAPAPIIPAASSAITITLGTTGDFERRSVSYGCQGQEEPLVVDYLNAAPNYLALIPVDGSVLVFNTVLSASGARYAAGKYVWSTKGSDATLLDLTQGANAKPILTCSAVTETP